MAASAKGLRGLDSLIRAGHNIFDSKKLSGAMRKANYKESMSAERLNKRLDSMNWHGMTDRLKTIGVNTRDNLGNQMDPRSVFDGLSDGNVASLLSPRKYTRAGSTQGFYLQNSVSGRRQVEDVFKRLKQKSPNAYPGRVQRDGGRPLRLPGPNEGYLTGDGSFINSATDPVRLGEIFRSEAAKQRQGWAGS